MENTARSDAYFGQYPNKQTEQEEAEESLQREPRKKVMQTLKRVVVINGNISIAGKQVQQKLQLNAYKNTEREPAPTQT